MTVPIREALVSLPGVMVRRMATREGFFTAGRMFALLDRRSLLLRLPNPAAADLLARSRARSMVGFGMPVSHAWVEMSLAGGDPSELTQLAASAHEAVRRLGRRGGAGRPAGRRRRRATGSGRRP